MAQEDLGASSWRGSSLGALGGVEHAVRCPICQGFMESPCSVSACGHSFCSECVRRALLEKKECPSCREMCTNANIVANRGLEAVIAAYRVARPHLLKVIENQKQHEVSAKPRPRTRREIAAAKALQQEQVEIETIHKPGLTERNQVPRSSKKSKDSGLRRIAHISYHLLKEKDLREKVRSLGLPITGSKDDLVFRHREFALKLNAILDRGDSVSVSQAAKFRKEVVAKEEMLKLSRKSTSLFAGSDKSDPSANKAMLALEASRQFKKLYFQLIKQVLAREPQQHKKIRKRVKNIRKEARRKRSQGTPHVSTSALEEATSPREPTTVLNEATSNDQFDPEALCNGPNWRKVWSPTLEAIIYFNSATNQAVVRRKNAETLAKEKKKKASPSQGSQVIELESDADSIEIEKDPASSSSPKEWHCIVCTFINSQDTASCTMCLTKRKAAPGDSNSARKGAKKQRLDFFTRK